MIGRLIQSFLENPYHWAEAWAPLIPVIVWLIVGRRHGDRSFPVVWYFVLAAFFGLTIDILWKFNNEVPVWAKDNNLLYNIQSMVRALVFVLFFHGQLHGKFRTICRFTAGIYALFILIFYTALSSITLWGSFGISAESLLLMILGILFLFQTLQDEQVVRLTGLCGYWFALAAILYSAANFSIFLIYRMLVVTSSAWATKVWDGHNAFYIIFCLLCARGIYESKR